MAVAIDTLLASVCNISAVSCQVALFLLVCVALASYDRLAMGYTLCLM